MIIGCDHAGFALKKKVLQTLDELKVKYQDYSPELIPNDDYPDIALKVAEKVVKSKTKGILICKSGAGMAMAANKVPGIRAGIALNKEASKLLKKDENANILVLSGKFENNDLKSILKAWINTKFEGGRHLRRLKKVQAIERKYSK